MTTGPLDLIAAMRLEDGRRWGEVATEWQLADARAVLTPGPDDARLHWLARPKGASKSTDLAAVALAWLLTQAAPLDEGHVIASDHEQARRLLTRAAGLIARTPGLDARLEVQSWAVVNRSTGAKVAALAADAAGAEGIVSPLLLLDELPQWPDNRAARGMWDAAFSSVPKVRGSRFVVIGHAGISGSWQHKLYEQAKVSDVWRVHDVPGPLDWLDERLLADQRATLTPTQYNRRHLNQWSTAEDSLTSLEDLRACVTLDGPLRPQAGLDYVVAVDIGLVNDRTVAVVAHPEALSGGPPAERAWRAPSERERYEAVANGLPLPRSVPVTEVEPVRIVLDRIETWQGSKARKVRLADVEDWLLQAHQSFNGAPVRVDPWQAVSTAQRLRANGVPVEEFTFSSASVGRLATTLHRLLRDGALALPDDDALLDELAHVRLVERTSGAVRMDHDSGRHDDRAIALAMAAAWLLERPPTRGVVVTEHGGRGNALARGRTVVRAR